MAIIINTTRKAVIIPRERERGREGEREREREGEIERGILSSYNTNDSSSIEATPPSRFPGWWINDYGWGTGQSLVSRYQRIGTCCAIVFIRTIRTILHTATNYK